VDPDANLIEQRQIAARIIEATDNERPVSAADAARLAELVRALHEWIATGGFLPAPWERGR
jgi:hypothetical protein